ncbi:MAG: isochorismatase family cysteine hydrolase [Thermodesulfobacteriota bacterium]|nr:isochorismatase family cysteine hydrolase [Thermodesulfobacteriota bacterium]
MSRKSLLVIDMLYDFMDPAGALYAGYEARKIIPRVKKLLESHRREGSLIVFAVDHHDPEDKEFEIFPRHCVAGTPGAEIIPELEVRLEDKLVHKTRYSAFYGTDLEDILAGEDIDEVHLCGVCTSICVMDTASDLRNRDYPTIVHKSAVADFDPQAHDFALKRMKDILRVRLED